MPSPIVTIHGSSTRDGYDAIAGSTITIALADATGVNVWSLEVIGTDQNHNKDTLNAGLSISQITKTATLTVPADAAAILIKSTVNNGLNQQFAIDATLSTTFGVYVLTTAGKRLIARGETNESSADFGWIKQLNEVVELADTLGSTLSGATVNVSANTVNLKSQGGTQRGYLDLSTSSFSWLFDAATSAVGFGQSQDPSGVGADWSLRAQRGAAGNVGGGLTLGGGLGGTLGSDRAGPTTIDLGQSVGGQSANLNITADTTRVLTIRDRVGGSSLICAGNPDATRRPLLLEGTSLNVESTSTTLSMVAVTDMYFSSSGTMYWRKSGVTAATETWNNSGLNSINFGSSTTEYQIQHNSNTRVGVLPQIAYLRANTSGNSGSIDLRYQSASGVAKQSNFYDTIQTTNATPTTVIDIPIPTGQMVGIEFRCTAVSGTNYAYYHRIAAYKNVSGTVSVIGTVSSPHVVEDAALSGADAGYVISGTSVRLTVTGIVGTIRWECHALVTYGSA
jgi:hypothetical protein